MKKYKLSIVFEDFEVGKEEYVRELIRLSDDLDELVNIANKYVNKFMQIKRDGWQDLTAEIQNQTVALYDLERRVYRISLAKRGTGA